MVILASASPRRKELLSKIISDFKVIPSNIDEESIINDRIPAKDIPEFLSTKKALDIHSKYPDDTIIAADTAIIFDNKIYGKPKNEDDAKSMLKTFSNNTHYVITGVCIICDNKTISFSSINEVEFYDLSDKEINQYLETDEYKDKAGSYAIQGQGAMLVSSIKGDYYSIVGLPVSQINRILKNFFNK